MAWLAGLLEGEGSFVQRGPRKELVIQMQMTDRDVVAKAHFLAGMGKFYAYPRAADDKRGWKDVYLWNVANQRHAYALMVAILPFMGARRTERIRGIILEWLHK